MLNIDFTNLFSLDFVWPFYVTLWFLLNSDLVTKQAKQCLDSYTDKH